MGLLQDYKICRKNENKWEITNLGAILFANNLAEVMFYLHLCEKRGSGIDRTVASLEEKHLPPYKVVKGQEFTRVFIYPEKSYKEMTKQEKIHACYQHACLLFEDGKQMTNQSLRERLSIGKNNSAGRLTLSVIFTRLRG